MYFILFRGGCYKYVPQGGCSRDSSLCCTHTRRRHDNGDHGDARAKNKRIFAHAWQSSKAESSNIQALSDSANDTRDYIENSRGYRRARKTVGNFLTILFAEISCVQDAQRHN